jgi:hypothetical protein
MEFINAEEFLKQDEQVQKVFLDWWNPSKGDLYCNLYNNQQDNILVINDCQLEIFKTFKDDIKQYGFPLLTEGQLRKFIEDKSNCKNVEILSDISTGQYYADFYENTYSGIEEDTIEYLGTNKFKAYWILALITAKESVK